MLGRLLCKLGVHDNQVGGWNWNIEQLYPGSIWGYCVRPNCNTPWQLDN